MTSAATSTEIAWAAGFFEGEGTVMLLSHKSSRSHARLSVEISQVDPTPLQFLQDRWQGAIYARAQRRPRQRPYSRWVVSGKQAAAFLADIEPFVVRPLVRERARLGVEYQAQKVSTWENRTPAYRSRQVAFLHRLNQLNRRGADDDLTELERAVLAARA